MCPTGKRGYKTKIDAQFALYECQRKNNKTEFNRHEQRVYFCPLCDQFHLTSKAKQVKETWKDLNNRGNK